MLGVGAIAQLALAEFPAAPATPAGAFLVYNQQIVIVPIEIDISITVSVH